MAISSTVGSQGYHLAAADFVGRFDCCRPSMSDLIGVMIDMPQTAQLLRGYVAFFVRHNLISRDVADDVLAELAPDHWLVRYLPDTFL